MNNNSYSTKQLLFLSKITKDGPIFVKKLGKCWVRTVGYLQGYGPSRQAYKLFIGEIPKNLDVCHHCDNPKCVRPSHLFIGTRKDNMQDCIKKGRHKSITNPDSVPKGDKHFAITRPELLARGGRHGSRTKPENLARGDKNGSRTHPEKLVRGDLHHHRIDSEPVRGENNGMAQLTEQQVIQIKKQFKRYINCRNPSNATELSVKYSVSKAIILYIGNGKTWRHVKC